MFHLDISALCAATALAAMSLAWAVSLPLRDASIADVAWGPTLAAVAWVAYGTGAGATRSLLLALLVTLWALRLALHIGVRNLGHGEDRRYAALRERDCRGFALRSLWSIFGIQATIAWIVGLPLQSAAADPTPDGIGVIAIVGALVALVGLTFEAIGDLQLRRFLARAESGDVLDNGLWRYTRHPNYFGDALFWWGTWIVAVEAGSPWWTFVGPALMTAILVRFTGARLLESTIGERRPAYREYVRRTSGFVPLPPRGGRGSDR